MSLADLCTVDNGKSYVLSVALAIGDVLLMSNYDDICPKVIHTSLAGLLLLTVKCLSSRSINLVPQFSITCTVCTVLWNVEAIECSVLLCHKELLSRHNFSNIHGWPALVDRKSSLSGLAF